MPITLRRSKTSRFRRWFIALRSIPLLIAFMLQSRRRMESRWPAWSSTSCRTEPAETVSAPPRLALALFGFAASHNPSVSGRYSHPVAQVISA